MAASDKDLGISFSDFLADLVGSNSNVKLRGEAAALGFDPREKDIVEQLQAAIAKSADSYNIEDATTLGSSAQINNHGKHQKLLKTLSEFYTKRYGSGPSAK